MSLMVRTSKFVPSGTFIWMRGSEVVGIATAERAKFLGQFGLAPAPAPPPEADGLVMSERDYEVSAPNLNRA